MRRTLYGVLFLFSGLVALSASAGDVPLRPHPAGCIRNACDVDRVMCERRLHCTPCVAGCKEMSGGDESECLIACRDLCDKEIVAKGCRTEERYCSFSTRNTFCTDGLDTRCVPQPSTTSTPIPSMKRRPGACTDVEVDQVVVACRSPGSTKATCEAFSEMHTRCASCVGDDDAWTSEGMCVATRGDAACGEAIHEALSCQHEACRRCSRGTSACLQAAGNISCERQRASMDACVAKLPENIRADCLTGEDFSKPAKLLIRQACGS